MMKSIVLVLSLLVTRVRPSTWGYRHSNGGDLDPEHWEPEVCQSGERQSPISIESSHLTLIRHSNFNLFKILGPEILWMIEMWKALNFTDTTDHSR